MRAGDRLAWPWWGGSCPRTLQVASARREHPSHLPSTKVLGTSSQLCTPAWRPIPLGPSEQVSLGWVRVGMGLLCTPPASSLLPVGSSMVPGCGWVACLGLRLPISKAGVSLLRGMHGGSSSNQKVLRPLLPQGGCQGAVVLPHVGPGLSPWNSMEATATGWCRVSPWSFSDPSCLLAWCQPGACPLRVHAFLWAKGRGQSGRRDSCAVTASSPT